MLPTVDMSNISDFRTRASAYFRALQERICAGLEDVDGAGRFREDSWQRPGGGGGWTRVLAGGDVFEKAGVNYSDVFGQMAPEFAAQVPGSGLDFTAAGISLVLHPRNPMVPTVHANFRFLTKGEKQWFGGGADLTPVLEKRRTQTDPDTIAFHAAMKAACDAHRSVAPYDKFKAWCDDYFFLKHRNEMRGIGGIFYDYLESEWEPTFAFTQDVGRAFLKIYPELVRRNFATPWTDAQREEQLVRRGRYVEFNLLYDRGTIFGLRTGGNVESILSSMPPVVKWP